MASAIVAKEWRIRQRRPIDADALEMELFDADWMLDNDEHMVEDILKKQPTLDVEVVVRCKDCKQWGATSYPWDTERLKCCGYGHYFVGANGYCVYGEVKDDASNPT